MTLSLQNAAQIREDVISFLNGKPKGRTAEVGFQSSKMNGLLASRNLPLSISVGLSAGKRNSFQIELRAYQKPALDLAKVIAKSIDSELGVDALAESPVVIRRAQRGKLFSFDARLEGLDLEIRPLRKHKRPLFIGQGIGNFTARGLGTVSVGCFLGLADESVGALSVSHGLIGLGDHAGAVGNRVSQPHSPDTSHSDHGHVIGDILFASSLRPNDETRADAAIIKLKGSQALFGNRVPDQGFDVDLTHHLQGAGIPPEFFGKTIGEEAADLFVAQEDGDDMRVFKLGAGSGWSEGRILGQRLLTTLYHDGEPYKFLDAFEVVAPSEGDFFSKAGDSGALVFYQKSGELRALGLIVGIQTIITTNRETGRESPKKMRVSIVCPLTAIREHLAANDQVTEWLDGE